MAAYFAKNRQYCVTTHFGAPGVRLVEKQGLASRQRLPHPKHGLVDPWLSLASEGSLSRNAQKEASGAGSITVGCWDAVIETIHKQRLTRFSVPAQDETMTPLGDHK